MKNLKIIPAVAFILIFASYYGIYDQYAVSSTFEDLSIKDKITYLSLDENDKIKIIDLPQDSIVMKADFSDSSKVILSNIPSEIYDSYQNMSERITTVSEYIFYAKRFILLLFVLTMSYLNYSKKHKFNITFQKILFENVLSSVVFTLFSVVAFLLTQTIRGNVGSTSYMFQMLIGDAVETLKYGLLYSVLIAVFIYFEPRNIHWYNKRIERKKKNEEKKA